MDNKAVRGLLRAATLFAASAVLAVGYPLPRGADESAVDRTVGPFSSNHETAFEAILRFGRENNMPIGVVAGDQLCSTVLPDFSTGRAPARTVLQEFVRNMPAYRWALEDGVVVFAPDIIPEATAQFLAIEPPSYAIPEETLQSQAFYAWMNIKAVLKPQEGTSFNILSSPQSEKWPALTLSHLTIQQTLDRLVARKTAGAWILLPLEDPSKIANRRPFWVIGYSDSGFGKLSSQCPRSEQP